MGWMIDPQESGVFAYQPNQTPQFFDQPQVQLPVPDFADAIGFAKLRRIALTVQQLFDWLMD